MADVIDVVFPVPSQDVTFEGIPGPRGVQGIQGIQGLNGVELLDYDQPRPANASSVLWRYGTISTPPNAQPGDVWFYVP